MRGPAPPAREQEKGGSPETQAAKRDPDQESGGWEKEDQEQDQDLLGGLVK